MDREQAERTSLLLASMNATLNRHLLQLQPQLPHDEFRALCEDIGRVMGELLSVTAPLYRQFPQLKPEELGGPYRMEFVEVPEAMFARKAIAPSAEFG
ncbi:hypothetical protein [Lysobacter enzymogenes]|uniref:hypothetical protein n=1 Tax=Lysobacter enzymogenes TaxID=69 RepID=UPI00099C0CD8|nr:hypothetical protein [Lysobacter enzymogenes]UZW62070.1 hypothetical protein BV903_007195 [Lysobacter enzymogenes]